MDAASILRILTIFIGALGILGNGLVCVVIAKVPAMRTLTNAFIFNQAVIDFLASLFMVIQNVTPPIPLSLHPNIVIAVLQCYIWDLPIIRWTLFVASTFNLVMLTSERYVAIVYPFRYLKYFGRKQATVMLVGAWVLAAAFKSHIYVHRQIIDGSCIQPSQPQGLSVLLGVMAFLVQYLIPLFFMTFCYIHIILRLKKGASIHAGPTTSQGENSMSGSLLRAKRNTLKTLFIVFVTYVICWSPNQIAFFMFNFGLKLNFFGAFYYTSVGLVQMNSCTNPIIYAFKYKQFRAGLRVLLSQCFPKLAPRPEEDAVPTITSRATATAGSVAPTAKIRTNADT